MKSWTSMEVIVLSLTKKTHPWYVIFHKFIRILSIKQTQKLWCAHSKLFVLHIIENMTHEYLLLNLCKLESCDTTAEHANYSHRYDKMFPEAEVFPLYETYNLSDLAPLLRSEKKKKRVSINESRTDSFFSYQIQTWQSWQPGKTPQSTSSWKHCQVWNKSKQIKTNSHYSRSWMRGREFGSKKENEKHISTLHLSCFFWGSKKPFTKENMPDFFCCACY